MAKFPFALRVFKARNIRFRQFLMAASGADQAADDIDSMVGFGRTSPHLAPSFSRSRKYPAAVFTAIVLTGPLTALVSRLD
jgi:hypothetical protein